MSPSQEVGSIQPGTAPTRRATWWPTAATPSRLWPPTVVETPPSPIRRQVASGTPGQNSQPRSAGPPCWGRPGSSRPNTSFTDTFPISEVTVTCLGTATSASGDGTWQGSGLTPTTAPTAATTLNDTVYFHRSAGQHPDLERSQPAFGNHRNNGPPGSFHLGRLGQRLLLPVRWWLLQHHHHGL